MDLKVPGQQNTHPVGGGGADHRICGRNIVTAILAAAIIPISLGTEDHLNRNSERIPVACCDVFQKRAVRLTSVHTPQKDFRNGHHPRICHLDYHHGTLQLH